MPSSNCVTALFDTCLFRISPFEEVVLRPLDGSVPSLLGPRNSSVEIVTRQVVNIPSDQHWKQAQSDAMIAVAKWAREGRVHLFTYSEIEQETLRGTFFPSMTTNDCLKDTNIDRVPAAIERSKFQQMSENEFCRKETRIQFLRWLLSLNEKDLAQRPRAMEMFTAFERRNVESLSRFREICKHVAENQLPDAFHLWTAEVNGFDYFITADRKFINVLTKSSRIALPTRPICPTDFVAELTQSTAP
jgi:predicted nucleic acid-binding protein